MEIIPKNTQQHFVHEFRFVFVPIWKLITHMLAIGIGFILIIAVALIPEMFVTHVHHLGASSSDNMVRNILVLIFSISMALFGTSFVFSVGKFVHSIIKNVVQWIKAKRVAGLVSTGSQEASSEQDGRNEFWSVFTPIAKLIAHMLAIGIGFVLFIAVAMIPGWFVEHVQIFNLGSWAAPLHEVEDMMFSIDIFLFGSLYIVSVFYFMWEFIENAIQWLRSQARTNSTK